MQVLAGVVVVAAVMVGRSISGRSVGGNGGRLGAEDKDEKRRRKTQTNHAEAHLYVDQLDARVWATKT